MVWETVSPPARQAPSPLWNGKPPLTMRPRFSLIKKNSTPIRLRPFPVAPAPRPGSLQSARKTHLPLRPVQIQLAPVNAPYFDQANLLIAADCCAYAYGDFHNQFMKNKITLIGCPKLDPIDYTEKLTEIIKQNEIKSVTVARMEVPCCGGIEAAVKNALQASGKFLPWQVVTISTDGRILD